jgi:glutamate dehydrogenase/leucine dehydrogenase
VVPAQTAKTTLQDRTAHWPVDDLGPAQVVFFRLATGHDAVVVVDNVALGQAIGGVRMTPTVDATEVAGLARAMTLKNAVAGLPYGGAKAGVVADPGMVATERERVIRAFAAAIGNLIMYIPGPDMGTDETAMAWIYDEIGRAVGLPAVLGGIPLDQIGATGFGLGVCAGVLQDVGLVHLPDSTVVIQGFGAVGRHAALALEGRGAKVIAVSDIGGATYSREGLDIDSLVHFKGSSSVRDFPGGRPVPRDDILRLDCDMLVPAAQAGVFTAANAGAVRAKVILQGANIPATPDAEMSFQRRGVLNIPDIVANAGGVICAAVEQQGGTTAQAFGVIEEKIQISTAELLDRAQRGKRSPRRAAEEIARDRIAAARGFRRRF